MFFCGAAPAGGGGKKEGPTESAPNGGPKAAPAEVSEGAELLAKAKGIDLGTITGSGPGGSIRRRDVVRSFAL